MRQLAGQRPVRDSMRSRDSSSTTESDPREKIKDCFRKFVAFMCTQVGVGALVVCYAVVGAIGFMSIETKDHDIQADAVKFLRHNCVFKLWNVTNEENVFNESIWSLKAEIILRDFQDQFATIVLKGYNGRTAVEVWNFPAALMFCLSVFTMIGYGNMVPRTAWGKGFTVVYAGVGIPIYILYFLNMGKIFAQSFKWLYTLLHQCSRERDEYLEEGELPPPRKKITVPSTSCIWVISFYILCGTIMFAEWEGWNYLDSCYFCVTSLCKIGFGDFVPGANISDSRSGSQTKLVMNFIYMLLGMGLVAMCYNLMREDVRVKARELKEDMGQCLEDINLGTDVLIVARGMAPLRLCSVPGHDGRINDVLFCPARMASPARDNSTTNTLVYFGGDVQDFPEVMETHRDNRNYMKWNLENVANLISNFFPKSHVVVVRPSRMEFKTFSCYDNFVPSSNGGVPDHTPIHYALHHLERLLQGITHRIKSLPDGELIDLLCTSFNSSETDIDVDILQVAMENTVAVHQRLAHPTISNSILQRHLENSGIASLDHDIPESGFSLAHIPEDGITASQDGFLPDDFPSCPSAAIQMPVINHPSVLVSTHCQSAIVPNPQSSNGAKITNPILDTLWWRDSLSLDKAPLTLVGFSKGCVVLNQLIYEFHYMKTLTPDDGTMMRFVSRITDMYWLDGGHAGGKNTWITSRSLLETLTRLNITVHIHVTPYQVCDDRRPWIRKEERQFCDLLHRLGAQPRRTLHFAQPNAHGALQHTPATLHTHFEVLSVFMQPNDIQ